MPRSCNARPGTACRRIRRHRPTNYDVSFPLYAKIEVNGDGAHPLYKWLKSQKPGMLGTEAVKWNFTKFLIDRTGQVRKRFAPTDTPENIEKDVALLLAEA